MSAGSGGARDPDVPAIGTANPMEGVAEADRTSRFPGPRDLFSPETFAGRRARLAERLGDGVLVLFGAKSVLDLWEERRFDPAFAVEAFRQEPNLFWLTGLEVPGVAVVLDAAPDGGPPGAAGRVDVFSPRPDRDREACRCLGLRAPRPTEEFEEAFGAATRGRPVYMIVRDEGVPSIRRGFAEESAFPFLLPGGEAGTCPDELLRARLQRHFRLDDVRSAVPLLTELRRAKDDEEVRALRKAAEATVAGFEAGIAAVAPGVDECEVIGEMDRAFRRTGAHRRSFAPVVQSGRDGLRSFVDVVDAYDGLNRTMRESELVLIDYGAELGYYMADLARTVPVSGRFSDRQRTAYQAYMVAYEAGLSAIGPGVSFMDVAAAAGGALRDALGDLPFWLRPATTDFAEAIPGQRPGHFLGLSLHEHEDYRVPMVPGEVLAYELHFRLPDQGWRISVEDMVLVTSRGPEVLTASLPRTADELEGLMTEPAGA